MNNPFFYSPTSECDEAFRTLAARIESLRESCDPADIAFIRELDAGKMLGVLIAEDADGKRHSLYAFSGQIGDGGFYRDGFVGPVFDYLQPGGYFKIHEADISRQNDEISLFQRGSYANALSEYQNAKAMADSQVEEFRDRCRRSKAQRDARRASGLADEAELAAMVRQSQFEKAELHRMKKRLAMATEPLASALEKASDNLERMKRQRHADSEALQKWLFDNFRLLNACGESRSLSEIFAETSFRIPPSGAGECCAPKLLQAAYLNHLTPVAMAEYWYGAPKEGEVRIHGRHYPACRGKCLPILTWMLTGLEIEPPLDGVREAEPLPEPRIIFENRWFCVVDKPSGMLSVPGKGRDVSVEQWLIEKYGQERQVRMAHRIDQDTSGLIIAAFGDFALKVIQTHFFARGIKKTYVALLEGDYMQLGRPVRGRISLPLSSDWLDRPRQRVDLRNGKPSETDYEFISTENGNSRVIFHPLTGRTHQLRVHAASQSGLGMPIIGDRLYCRNSSDVSVRLHLHAHKLEFTFPLDHRHYSFESPVPF